MSTSPRKTRNKQPMLMTPSCLLEQKELLPLTDTEEWKQNMAVERKLLAFLQTVNDNEIDAGFTDPTSDHMQLLELYQKQFGKIRGKIYEVLKRDTSLWAKNLSEVLNAISYYVNVAIKEIRKLREGAYTGVSAKWPQGQISLSQDAILQSLTFLKEEIETGGLTALPDIIKTRLAWCEQEAKLFTYQRREKIKRPRYKEVPSSSSCIPDPKQIDEFKRLTAELRAKRGWNADDFWSVARVLRRIETPLLPKDFALHKSRFHQGSFRADTPGSWGKRGRLLLPSYLYQMAEKGCPHLGEINKALQDIVDARFLTEEKEDTWNPLGSNAQQEWNAKKQQIVKQDVSMQECLDHFGNDIRDFLQLILLSNLGYGADIHALVQVLGLQKLLNKLSRKRYRVGDLHSVQPGNLLSSLLLLNCDKLHLLNHFIYKNYLNQDQKKAFLSGRE